MSKDSNTAPASEAELQEMVRRAESGDRSALPALRAYLDQNKTFWTELGDLATWSTEAWLDLIAGKNLLFQESLRRRVRSLQAALGADSSPLESLLVARITATWLAVNYADTRYAQVRNANGPDQQLRVIERLQERTHARHLAALKALASVRKLLTKPPAPLDLIRPIDESPGRRRKRTTPRSVGVNN